MAISANPEPEVVRTAAGAAITAYVAVGSNIRPERNIGWALAALASRVEITAVSTCYCTPPLGDREQPDFVNGVWRIATTYPPRRLKYQVLRGVEATVGRVRTADRFAPREIDLDLVLYGEEVIDEPGLRLPDPEILERPFLAVPLLELAPGLVLPGDGVALAAAEVARDTAALEPLEELTERLKERVRQ